MNTNIDNEKGILEKGRGEHFYEEITFNDPSCTNPQTGDYDDVTWHKMQANGAINYIERTGRIHHNNICAVIRIGVRADSTIMNASRDIVAAPCPPCCHGNDVGDVKA